jgi:predicted RNase H-like nuclease (RuvC/YqgF family)
VLPLYIFPNSFLTLIVSMAIEEQESHEELVERLTNGFGALLEQVQELASKNQDLEKRLARVREEVSSPLHLSETSCNDENL